eukprot:4669397-Pyramimonas_sp.AAC.1
MLAAWQRRTEQILVHPTRRAAMQGGRKHNITLHRQLVNALGEASKRGSTLLAAWHRRGRKHHYPTPLVTW